jgi:hypothetical protein
MQLSHPRQELAGCCWLPRLADKARAHLRGEIPLSYRIAFGSRIGIDGFFLRHFGLSMEDVTSAVRDSPTNRALGLWFLARPGVSAQSIACWNRLAPRLGTKNHPAYVTLHIVKWILYPKMLRDPVPGVFGAIVQDEGLETTPLAPDPLADPVTIDRKQRPDRPCDHR